MLALLMALGATAAIAIAVHAQLRMRDSEVRLADTRLQLYTLVDWLYRGSESASDREVLRAAFPELYKRSVVREAATDGSAEPHT